MISLHVRYQSKAEHCDFRPKPRGYWAVEADRGRCPDPEMPLHWWRLRIAGLMFEIEVEP